MITDSETDQVVGSISILADGSCRLELTEAVPLTRDAELYCTVECDGEDWSVVAMQENSPDVKQEPDDVRFLV